MMARNCPSYKTLYQETSAENRELKRKLRSIESKMEVRDLYEDDKDEEVTITARARELQDPRLDLEGRAVLLVWL
jgi:hypothetical protein